MIHALLLAACLAPQDLEADYVFRVENPSDNTVACSLHLEGLSGPLELGLPKQIAYASPPEPRLQGPLAIGTAQGTLKRLTPFLWRLEPSGSAVDLSWIVPLDHRSLPSAQRSSYELPYLDLDHGFLATAVLAIAPTGAPSPASGAIRMRLELPDEWEAVVPWAELEPNLYGPESWGQLQNDLIAIGAWDLTHRTVAGVEIAVAFAPGLEFLGDATVEKICAAIEREVQLFGRVPNERYAFFFSRPEMGGLGGSVKSSSMTLLVDPNLPKEFVEDNILHLIAHEYHHTWMHSLQPPPNQEEIRFLGEGFTDYFSYLVPWWLGFDDDQKLLDTLNGKLAEYEGSQGGMTRSLVEAGGPMFFEDPSASSAVYSGGLVLALLAEIAILQEGERSGSESNLNTVLREFFDGSRTNTDAPRGLESLLAILSEIAGEEFSEQARAFVNHRGPVDLVDAFARLDIEVGRRESSMDLTSLRANLDGTTLLGIDSSDAATRIGLRSGDKLMVVNGQEVLNEEDVRRAWRQPKEGRLRVALEREGEPMEINRPLPREITYELPPEFLEILRWAETRGK